MAPPHQEKEMNIHLKIRKTVALKVKKSETIKGLIDLVNREERSHEDMVEFFRGSDQLDENKSLLHYGIRDGSTINLDPMSDSSIEVKLLIKITSTRNTIMVEALAHDTIRDVKSIIGNLHQNLRAETFSLMYNGKVLEDSKTVASLNLQSEEPIPTMYLVVHSADTIKITVKTPSGPVKLKVGLLFTVCDVTDLARSMAGITKTGWTLRINSGFQLDDRKTLAFYQIKDGYIFKMKTSPFQIFVKTLSSKTITVEVKPHYLVGRIKVQVFKKPKVSPDFQKFVFAGKQLEDSRSFSSYDVTKHSTLHMTMGTPTNVILPEI